VAKSGSTTALHSRKGSVQELSRDTAKSSAKKSAVAMCSAGMQTGSTVEGSTGSASFVKFNDPISQEREQLIQYNKLCMQSYESI